MLVVLASKPPTRRLNVPNEPGEWVEIRRPTTGELRLAAAAPAPDNIVITIQILAACIHSWSYPVPVTVENVDDQDQDWMLWLGGEARNFYLEGNKLGRSQRRANQR